MNGNKRKLMVFHQYLAPYRIDFFNALARIGEMEAFFEYENSPDHHYNRREMEARCAFRPQYLNHVRVAGRRVPSGLARILRQGRPGLVIVPEFSILALEVCLLRAVCRWKFKIVSICDDSMDMIRGNELSRMHALARKAAMPVMDDVILPDMEACRWYREHYGKGVFFPIVRDERAFREQCREALSMSLSMQREYGLHGKRVVLYVGRLAPEKNLECLVRAAAALPEDAVLVIAGSGSLGPELQDLAVRLKVSAIFTGWKASVWRPGTIWPTFLFCPAWWNRLGRLSMMRWPPGASAWFPGAAAPPAWSAGAGTGNCSIRKMKRGWPLFSGKPAWTAAAIRPLRA